MTHDVHVNSLKKGCICTLETNTGKKQSLSGGELGDNPLLLQCLRDFCVADFKSSIIVNGFPCKPVSQVTSDDFFFDGFSKPVKPNQFGIAGIAGNVLAFPALNTLGISMNRVEFSPQGLNPPHSHPRAAEVGVVIQGELLVGFLTTSNVFHSKVLKAGHMFVVPPGLIHFQMNVGKGRALAFTAFNSQLPGVAASSSIFNSTPPIPNKVLTKAFHVTDDVINIIKSKSAHP